MTNIRQSNGLVSDSIQYTSDAMVFGRALDEESPYVENVWA